MKVIKKEAGPLLTNCYLAIDEEASVCAVIDVPLEGSSELLQEITKRKLKVKAILLTHAHWDHCGDAAKMKRKTKAPIYAHKKEEYRLKEPNKHTVIPLPEELQSAKIDKYVEDGDVLEFGNIKLEARHVPGHTEGSLSFVEKESKIIFSGDALFNGSIGRTDLPGGSMDDLLKSIARKILTLENDYVVYSGHGPNSTIGEEKQNNPFLKEISYG